MVGRKEEDRVGEGKEGIGIGGNDVRVVNNRGR